MGALGTADQITLLFWHYLLLVFYIKIGHEIKQKPHGLPDPQFGLPGPLPELQTLRLPCQTLLLAFIPSSLPPKLSDWPLDSLAGLQGPLPSLHNFPNMLAGPPAFQAGLPCLLAVLQTLRLTSQAIWLHFRPSG